MTSTLPERSLDLWRRGKSRVFSRFLAPSFGAIGARVSIEPPFRVYGARWMMIGDGVAVGPSSWFQVIGTEADRRVGSPVIRVGAGSSFVGWCTLSAVREISIGDRVMFARGVYVADHDHAYRAADVAIRDQGYQNVAPVRIGDGAWLGQNCVITAGSTIGRGAVVGANSVVKGSVPDFSLAVGAPARVVRSWAPDAAPKMIISMKRDH